MATSTETKTATGAKQKPGKGPAAAHRVEVSAPAPSGGLAARQHRAGLIALFAVLVVVFALAGAWLYSSAGSKTTVLVAASDIQAGQVIARSDLTTADVAGDVSALPAAEVGSVVGEHARVALLAGTVLQHSMLAAGADIPPGHVLAGVLLPPGAAPAGGVQPGDRVDVYRLPGKTAGVKKDAAAARVLASDVVVRQVARRESAGQEGMRVTLVLPDDATAAALAAAGAGAVAVVVVGP